MWAAGLVSLCLVGLTANEVSAATPPKEAGGLVVHEWGTFSTFSGSNGAYQKFYVHGNDLPEFVYRSHIWDNTKSGRGAVLVSLETPVLYFYSERELTASVRVDFPEGVITDWYPEASRPPDHKLQWDRIKVLPRGQAVPLPTLKEGVNRSRYFAAREVDASPVQIVGKKDKLEHEQFLFYRGVGDFQMPLKVEALGHGIFTVTNTGTEAIPAFLVVHIQDGKVRFRKYGHLSQKSAVKHMAPAADSSTAELAQTMVQLLIDQGLFEKEARAMVKTWQADWFGEEGTRVLYLVPNKVTDAFLPLQVKPKPETLVRVLVGRHDILTPEQEKRLDELTKKSDEYQRAVEKIGRYAWPAAEAARTRVNKEYAEKVKQKP
ncbi:hypothetical protein AYO40_05590 [Planctomycetaceae bacterium SCGC AG-212-D15]|nr:hypothetical protein AYO40_05590 [Planctomycetaceae bacterium SCGC AG-212-D15]